MSYLIGIGMSLIISSIIAFFWVRGIDYMKENHPDYKGEDFLNWNNEDINDEYSKQQKQNYERDSQKSI